MSNVRRAFSTTVNNHLGPIPTTRYEGYSEELVGKREFYYSIHIESLFHPTLPPETQHSWSAAQVAVNITVATSQ